MTMKKKMLAGAVTLLSLATLAACSQGAGKDIVTMKGETITVEEFYNKIKTSPQTQQALVDMTINQVFEAKYGKKITDKEVDAEYDKTAKAYGDSFNQVLAQQGLTADTFRTELRARMLGNYVIKQAAEKEINDEALKTAYNDYTPEVTTQIVKVADEETAKQVKEKADAGEDFAGLAKEYSTDTDTKDKGGESKFDSGTTTVPTDVRNAAFALENGQVSDVITVTNNLSSNYYVVKMVSKSEKKADWKEYKDRLKEILVASKTADQSFVQSVIAKEMADANIKIKDPAFQNIFNQYISSQGATSSSK